MPAPQQYYLPVVLWARPAALSADVRYPPYDTAVVIDRRWRDRSTMARVPGERIHCPKSSLHIARIGRAS